ncbi:hypothetical protein ACIRL3_23915 [Streptomyces sp. NPDC102384]|uniref:hypothetical protein n=1 Tax=Streptomyces sp. NPDC102384 TaxID=3366166 RepID=UPI00382168DC
MERRIDFARDRHMLCPACGHRWLVDLDWIDRWEQAQETCPGCDVTCEHEDSPRVTVDPDDLALDDDRVAQLSWYHTSTQPDWPTRDFDPASALTAEIRTTMGGDEGLAKWAATQQAKALHAGTYEAAVHNMLRWMRDQADRSRQFYLYRLHLQPSVVVRDGWVIDPADFAGNVALDNVCPPGVDVARYLNYHEAPGGISLALGRDAIARVQRISVPLPGARGDGWVRDAVAALVDAAGTTAPPTGRCRSRRSSAPTSPRVLTAKKLATALAARLPINLRSEFESAAAFTEGDDPVKWARRTSGLCDLIEDPRPALAALDRQGHRQV